MSSKSCNIAKNVDILAIFKKVPSSKRKKLFHSVNLIVSTCLVAQMKAMFLNFQTKKEFLKNIKMLVLKYQHMC